MARFSFEDVEHYQSKGNGAGFFKLVNDKDVATIRLLYNNADDIEGFSCHSVEIGDKFRYVNCLRTYRDPIDDCPLCKSGNKAQAKLFIPLYNEDAQEVQVWERGSKFFAKVSGVCTRYGKKPIVSQTFEVERSGKPKDTSTDYNFYRTDDEADDKTLDDFEMPKILGGIVIDATADDMEYYLDNGEFPPADEDDTPRRSSRRERDEEEERPTRRSEGRRTPARSRRNEDEF
jgi:hypothetical protein